MKTKTHARVLSWILSICMIAALIPAMPAEYAQAADGEVITYSFLSTSMNDTANKAPLVDATTKVVHTGVDEFADVKTGQPWKLIGVNDTSTYNTFGQYGTGIYFNIISGKTPTANIVLDFGKTGYYAASATAYMANNADYANLSLTPCDENGNVLSGATTINLGTADAHSTTGAKDLFLSNVYLDSEYYLLKYAAAKYNGGNFYLQALKFTELALAVNIETPAPVAVNSSNLTEVTVTNPTALETALDYTVSASSDLAAFSVEDGKLKISAGATAGREVVEVTFAADGKSQAVKVPIIVYDPQNYDAQTYEYNYLKGNVGTFLNKENTTYVKTSVGATGEINPQRASEPWKFVSATHDFKLNNHHAYGAYYYNVTNAVGKVKFYLPTSGIYEIYSKNYTSNQTGVTTDADISFSLQRADGTGTVGTDTVLGSINTKTDTVAYTAAEYKIGDNVYTLEAGEYILTYTVNCASKNYCFPAGFKLVGLGGSEIVASSDIATTLSVDGSSSSSFSVEFNGTTQDATIKVDNKNKDVVSVSESGGAYTFKALKEGFAKIVVTGTFGTPAITCTKEYGITVRNPLAAGANPVYYFSGMTHDSTALFSDSNKDKSADEKLEDVITYKSTESNNSSPWKIFGAYRSGLSTAGTAARNTFVNPDNITVTNDGGSTSNVQIGIKVPVSGYYTITTDADFENAEGKGKLTIYEETASSLNTSSPVYTQQAALKDVFNVNNPIYLEAEGSETGITNYRFYFESNSYDITLYSMTLVPYTEPEVEEIPEIFGDTYAYIRETVEAGKTDYTLVLVAAINSLNYKEVGFGISDSSLDNTEAGTDKVYTEIQVNGASYTAADFGLTGGYLFVREIPVASANAEKSIDFWAYAIENDDAETKTTGGKRTIDALVKPE